MIGLQKKRLVFVHTRHALKTRFMPCSFTVRVLFSPSSIAERARKRWRAPLDPARRNRNSRNGVPSGWSRGSDSTQKLAQRWFTPPPTPARVRVSRADRVESGEFFRPKKRRCPDKVNGCDRQSEPLIFLASREWLQECQSGALPLARRELQSGERFP
jgi:hypothetical protein